MPNVFINGQHIGGCDTTIKLHSNGTLARQIVEGQLQKDQLDPSKEYEYDLIVIGGGSGGLACAKVGGVSSSSVVTELYVCLIVGLCMQSH